MKIDRRSFLSFLAGGAAGTALSPLPWKLIDDSSIWSQTWPWVPVPKNGDSIYVDTICSLCPGACGITVRKIDNRAVKIEGTAGHPINDGGICPLGLSGLQFLYGPSRVKAPMKRVGERGSGKWQKISWDEAISFVVNELKRIRNDNKSDRVACFSDHRSGTVSSLMQRFLQAYGSPNLIQIPTGRDISELALRAICGVESTIDFDFENSDFILSLGSGLVDGWYSPVRMIKTNSNWINKGIRVVQVEPTLSNTAAKASQWIPINPGSEAELAFGIASFMLSEGMYDKDFVSQRAVEFSSWKKILLDKYSLSFVSKATGIPVNTIVDLSMSFVRASSPIAICGRGNAVRPSSFKDYISTYLLNIIKGNVNKKGGVWISRKHDYIEWPLICLDEIAKKGLGVVLDDEANTIINDNIFFDYFEKLFSDCELNGIALEALFVDGSNPYYGLSDTKSVKKSFERIPLLVSFSSFMDETTLEADLVLPSNIYLENLEDISVPVSFGRTAIGLSKPVVSAQFDTRHLGETIIDIAHRFGGTISDSFPWASYEECLEVTLGDKLELMAGGKLWVEDGQKILDSAKFNFVGAEIQSIQPEGDVAFFPLLLIPHDLLCLSSACVASSPFMVKSVSDTVIKGDSGFVDINSQTAQVMDLDEGDDAILSTPKGEVAVRIHLYDGVRPGVVTMVRGLGHTAYDEYIADKGVNINDLIGPVVDPVIGHDAFWGIRAKLTKA